MIPFQYRVEFYNPAFELVEIFTNIEDCSWGFLRNGGCHDCTIQIRAAFGSFDYIGTGYNIKIFIKPEKLQTGSGSIDFTHVFSGYVADWTAALDRQDSYQIKCFGYSSQMANILVGYDQTIQYPGGTAISAVVANIAEKLIARRTSILYSASKITATDRTLQAPWPENGAAMGTAVDAINTLCGLAGNYEWGVDKDRYFYFRPASTAQQIFVAGGNVNKIQASENYDDIKNRLAISSSFDFGPGYEIYESTTDQVKSLVAQGADDLVLLGSTGHGVLTQSFPKTRGNISKIAIKAQYAGPDSGEKITNGNMESTNSISPWLKKGLFTELFQIAFCAYGSKALYCRAYEKDAGFYQYFSVTPGKYTLEFSAWVTQNKLSVSVVDTGINGNLRGNVVEIGRAHGGYKKYCLQFDVPESVNTVYVRFLSANMLGAFFGIDGVSCKRNPGTISAALYTSGVGGELLSKISTVQITSSTHQLFEFPIHYIGNNDGITTYWLRLWADDFANDDYYFEVLTHYEDEISGGRLYLYDPSDWTEAQLYDGALCLDVFYNESIELYGLHEEKAAPPGSGAMGNIQEWVDTYLADKSRPFKQITADIEKLRTTIDSQVPAAGLGDIVIKNVKMSNTYGELGPLPITEIEYKIEKNEMTATVKSGKKLPGLAYRLKYLEYLIESRIGW